MTKEEQIIFDTCNEIYKSKVIKVGMCLSITAILFQYFQAKNIKIKVHVAILHNPKTTESMIVHNWISYSGKKCDITADQQLVGFKRQVIILDEEISEQYNNDDLKIYNLYNQFDHNKEPSEDPMDIFKYKMFLQASDSEDASFSTNLIDEFIKEQNEEFQNSLKNLKFDSKVSDIINLITEVGKNFD